MNHILHCNIWCYKNPEQRELGLDGGDEWRPMSFKLSEIVAVRESISNEFTGDHRATIYIDGDNFVSDLTYQDAVQIWKEYLTTTK